MHIMNINGLKLFFNMADCTDNYKISKTLFFARKIGYFINKQKYLMFFFLYHAPCPVKGRAGQGACTLRKLSSAHIGIGEQELLLRKALQLESSFKNWLLHCDSHI